MNKKGFTLMELLVVIVIVAVVSVGATISFSTIDDNTAVKEKENKFKEIQKSASLYVDLSDQATLNQFITDKKLPIAFSILAAENYIDKTVEDPVTGNILFSTEEATTNNDVYYVMLYIEEKNEIADKVSSCIVKHRVNENDPYYICYANSEGKLTNDCGECLKN